jgi:TolB protein
MGARLLVLFSFFTQAEGAVDRPGPLPAPILQWVARGLPQQIPSKIAQLVAPGLPPRTPSKIAQLVAPGLPPQPPPLKGGVSGTIATAIGRGVGAKFATLVTASGPGSPRSPGPLLRLTRDGLDKYRPSWAPDGRRILFARRESEGSHIWQYVLDIKNPGADARRLTDRKEPEYNGAFSPDGGRVLFVAIALSGTQGNLDIAMITADGTGLKTISKDEGKLVHQDWPSWSPDGRRFAFSSTHDGNQEIYTAAADGSDVVRLTQNPSIDAHPCWSPDGRRIVFATDRWGGLELAAVGPDGAGLSRLTRSPGLDDYPSYSPDGTRLTFVSNRDGQFEIYCALADGSSPFNLSNHPLRDTFPTWTPDGRGVTFVSNRDGVFDLYTQNLEQ